MRYIYLIMIQFCLFAFSCNNNYKGGLRPPYRHPYEPGGVPEESEIFEEYEEHEEPPEVEELKAEIEEKEQEIEELRSKLEEIQSLSEEAQDALYNGDFDEGVKIVEDISSAAQ